MAMRIASIDELETSSRAGRWSSPGRAENDRTKRANELVRALVGLITKEGDTVVASDSKSKLWGETHEFEASNTKLEHDICRHCEESRVNVESAHHQ